MLHKLATVLYAVIQIKNKAISQHNYHFFLKHYPILDCQK